MSLMSRVFDLNPIFYGRTQLGAGRRQVSRSLYFQHTISITTIPRLNGPSPDKPPHFTTSYKIDFLQHVPFRQIAG